MKEEIKRREKRGESTRWKMREERRGENKTHLVVRVNFEEVRK